MITKITINNREYNVEATGLKNVAYTLTSGKKVCKGVRNQNKPNVIIVMNEKCNQTVGYFNETTGKEMTAL